MRTEIRNRLLMTREPVSARHEPTSADHYAWMWVLPISDGRFRIALIEVPKHFVDNDEYFYEEDYETRFLKIVDSVDDVDSAVQEAGGNPDILDVPWRNDFPF